MKHLLTLAVVLGTVSAAAAAAAATSAKVTKVVVNKDHSALVTIDKGNSDGVDTDWTCSFVDAKEAPASTDCALVRIDKHISTVKTALAKKDITGKLHVALVAPAGAK